MTKALSQARAVALLGKLCGDMEASVEQLGDLDAKVGDGDLGVTVKLGFAAVRENLARAGDRDIGAVLAQSGMSFNRAAASTFGTLMATLLMRAGKAAGGKAELTLSDLAAMAAAAVDGVMERGKAAPGERTMLDALVPARDALVEAARRGAPVEEALHAAAEAAARGAEATAGMKAKHGRAGWLADKAAGVPDAGATAVALMLRSLSKHLGE